MVVWAAGLKAPAEAARRRARTARILKKLVVGWNVLVGQSRETDYEFIVGGSSR